MSDNIVQFWQGLCILKHQIVQLIWKWGEIHHVYPQKDVTTYLQPKDEKHDHQILHKHPHHRQQPKKMGTKQYISAKLDQQENGFGELFFIFIYTNWMNGAWQHKSRPAEHLNFHHSMPPIGTEGMYHNTSALIHGIAL
jgi:hypothetical protein